MAHRNWDNYVNPTFQADQGLVETINNVISFLALPWEALNIRGKRSVLSQCLSKPCTPLLWFLVKPPYMVKVEAVFQLFCCIVLLCFYHPLFSSTPLLIMRYSPKSVFLCFGFFFQKLFAYFHLSSCNFDQLCRFCMLPQSWKQLHTVTVSSVCVMMASWGHNQCSECSQNKNVFGPVQF